MNWLSKEDSPSPLWQASSNPLGAQIEQKGKGRANSSSLWGEIQYTSSPVFRSVSSWFPGVWTQTELTPAFLILQLADGRYGASWLLSPHEPIPRINILIYFSTFLIYSVSPENPNTQPPFFFHFSHLRGNQLKDKLAFLIPRPPYHLTFTKSESPIDSTICVSCVHSFVSIGPDSVVVSPRSLTQMTSIAYLGALPLALPSSNVSLCCRQMVTPLLESSCGFSLSLW